MYYMCARVCVYIYEYIALTVRRRDDGTRWSHPLVKIHNIYRTKLVYHTEMSDMCHQISDICHQRYIDNIHQMYREHLWTNTHLHNENRVGLPAQRCQTFIAVVLYTYIWRLVTTQEHTRDKRRSSHHFFFPSHRSPPLTIFTAAHCNTLQNTSTHSTPALPLQYTLVQHTPHKLQHTATHSTPALTATHSTRSATHSSHTATCCNTLYSRSNCNTLYTLCNTLHTHYNTLQHTLRQL